MDHPDRVGASQKDSSMVQMTHFGSPLQHTVHR